MPMSSSWTNLLLCLTPQEVEELFKIMRFLVDQGKSIIFITHKLGEVLECSDRITVIRGGKVVLATTLPKDASTKKLAAMMVGRDVELQIKKARKHIVGDVILRCSRTWKVLNPQNQIDGGWRLFPG